MIFVTIGTAPYPFDRLLKALDEEAGKGQPKEKIFAQTGYSRYRPRHFNWAGFLTYQEMLEWMQKADLVLTHGGVGSIILCLKMGKEFIVFPRNKKFGEHVDDHQVEFVRVMEERGKIEAIYNESKLMERMKNYKRSAKQMTLCEDSQEKSCLMGFLEEIINQ